MSPRGCLPGTETLTRRRIGTPTRFLKNRHGFDNASALTTKGAARGPPLFIRCLQVLFEASSFVRDTYQTLLAGQPPLPPTSHDLVTTPSALLAIVNVLPLLAPAFAVTVHSLAPPSAALR